MSFVVVRSRRRSAPAATVGAPESGPSAVEPMADASDAWRITNQLDPTIVELDEHQCWELLRSQEVGRLAVAIANHPDIFPVNFVVDHATVVFRTAEGTKLAAAVLGESVAFEVDGQTDGAAYVPPDVPADVEAWSVVVKGRAVEIERMYELFDAV